MLKFETLLDAQDTAFDLENKLKAIFPNSYVNVRGEKSLGGGFHVCLHFALGLDRSEWQNGIIQNDPAYTILFIWAGSVEKAQFGYQMKKAGIPAIRDKKNIATAEEAVKHIVTFFTKHKDAIEALRGVRY